MRLIDAHALYDQFLKEMETLVKSTNHEDIDLAAISMLCGSKMITDAQTVDAAPVVHGRWEENKYGYIMCSNCNCYPLEAMTGSLITMHYEPYESKYCPHCGAKMDLEEKEENDRRRRDEP